MRSLERDIEDCIQNLFDVSREWSQRVAVERGMLFDPLTHSEVPGRPDYLLRMAVCDFMISKESENGSVNRYPGVFAVNVNLLDLTEKLNAAKYQFELSVKLAEQSGYGRVDIREIYRRTGHARLHPKQAWRQIVILDPLDLQSVGFTVAKHIEASKLMTPNEASDLLIRYGAYDIADQIALSDATKIRWHEPVSKHVRANVVWGVKEERRSQMYYSSLPFLVPEGCWPAKRVRFNVPRTHTRRADFKQQGSIPLPFKAGSSITLLRE